MDLPIQIPLDEKGFLGRECPEPDCEGYFKIMPGTGLQGEDLPCHCPYCGFEGPTDQFWTKEQLDYVQSIIAGKVMDYAYKELKKHEFDHKPEGPFGIGISMKVQRPAPVLVRHYSEQSLETEAVCDKCSLNYAVYGVFAFCPDCGQHNSLQILNKNLEVVSKMLDISEGMEEEMAEKLIENALGTCVSAFDGFGREICRVNEANSLDPAKTKNISFQSLEGARSNLQAAFDLDISACVTEQDWTSATRGFQKRHLVAHKMGVVDDEYLRKTSDPEAVVGRKIVVSRTDVTTVAGVLQAVGQYMASNMGSTHE
jgi:Zn ribbon nucleic-acid-binding protein